jgi:hypothetical protein
MGRVRSTDDAKGASVAIATGPFKIKGETKSEIKAGH